MRQVVYTLQTGLHTQNFVCTVWCYDADWWALRHSKSNIHKLWLSKRLLLRTTRYYIVIIQWSMYCTCNLAEDISPTKPAMRLLPVVYCTLHTLPNGNIIQILCWVHSTKDHHILHNTVCWLRGFSTQICCLWMTTKVCQKPQEALL